MSRFLSISFLCAFSIVAQDIDKQFEMAARYENDGAFENAVAIYERLYKLDSNNVEIIEHLKKNYKILNNQTSRVQLLQRQLRSDSANVTWLCELVDAFYRSKNTVQAKLAIETTLRAMEKSVVGYRMLAGVMIENRWFDEVERVYLLARKNLAKEDLFVLEMANLQMYRGDYYRAAKEMLKYYRLNEGAYTYVQSQLQQFPDEDKDIASLIKALQEELLEHKKDWPVQKLLLDVYFKGKKYDQAFELSKVMDQQAKHEGLDLLNFANTTFQSGVYEIASKGYAYFLQLYPNSPQAEIGIARCYEKLSSQSGNTSIRDTATTGGRVQEKSFSNQAVVLYRAIIQKYLATEWAAEAHYRLGEIYLEKFQDVDEALGQFEQVQTSFGTSAFEIDAEFRTAECLIIQGKLDEALKMYVQIRTRNRGGDSKDEAKFRAGEIYYYQNVVDSCLSVMRELSRREDGVFVNDALSYLLLIQESDKDREGLKTFAKAQLLNRQRKYSEAMTVLKDLITRDPQGALVDDALLETAVILVRQEKSEEAIKVLSNVVEFMKTSPVADLAQMKIGMIYEEKMQKPLQAIKAYKELLLQFPRSIYLSQVRKRMRELEQKIQKSS